MKLSFSFLFSLFFVFAPILTLEAGPCTKEIERYCPHQQGRALTECIRVNRIQFSTECQDEMAKEKKKFKEIKESCYDDAEKFCSDIQPGKGRIVRCLKGHRKTLSSMCKADLPKK